MKTAYILSIMFLGLLTVPLLSASAETALRVSDSVSVSADQTVAGDFYGFAGRSGAVSISGDIEGDAHVVGISVTTNGIIEGDLFAITGIAQVHASVTDDVRIIAGEVTIAEYVGGDVFVLGGILTVLSSATIDGDVFFYGGEGEIEGTVGGSVFGTSEQLRIDGTVSGSVDVTVGSGLILGDRANIGGDVRYKSTHEIVRAPNAVIVGDTVQNSPKIIPINPRKALVPFLIYAFSTLIVFMVVRKHLHAFLSTATASFARNGLIGLVGVLFIPVASGLLVVSVIGAVIGLLGFLTVMSMYVLSFILTALFMGFLLTYAVKKKGAVTLLGTLCGIVATELLFFIPVIGPVIVLALMVVIFGTLLMSMYSRIV